MAFFLNSQKQVRSSFSSPDEYNGSINKESNAQAFILSINWCQKESREEIKNLSFACYNAAVFFIKVKIVIIDVIPMSDGSKVWKRDDCPQLSFGKLKNDVKKRPDDK